MRERRASPRELRGALCAQRDALCATIRATPAQQPRSAAMRMRARYAADADYFRCLRRCRCRDTLSAEGCHYCRR